MEEVRGEHASILDAVLPCDDPSILFDSVPWTVERRTLVFVSSSSFRCRYSHRAFSIDHCCWTVAFEHHEQMGDVTLLIKQSVRCVYIVRSDSIG